MSSDIEVVSLDTPTRAWRLTVPEGRIVRYHVVAGALSVLELTGDRLSRTDFTPDGRTQERVFDGVADPSLDPGERWFDLVPLGQGGACILSKRQLWTCRGTRCVRTDLDGRDANTVVPLKDGRVEVHASFPEDTAYHRYVLGPDGATHLGTSIARAPLAFTFDFSDVSVDVYSDPALVRPAWSVTIRRHGHRPRVIGGLAEIWSCLWFDGSLIVRDDFKRAWAIPITRDSAVDRLQSLLPAGLSLTIGADLAWGSRATVRRASAALEGHLDGWTLSPFSRYSTRAVERHPDRTKLQWSSFDSPRTGFWEFVHPPRSFIAIAADRV